MIIPLILRSVAEYDCVKRKTSHPVIMRRAADTPLREAKEVHYFVSRMCIHLNISLPKIRTGNGYNSWARVINYTINIGLRGANAEIVLHELSHLICPKSEPLGTQRKTYHGSDFVKTLDRLLLVWDGIQ